MLERLELEGVGPAPRLSFDFKPRLNLLTGDNGLGKTFVLELVWWALAKHGVDPEVPALPRPDWKGTPKVSATYSGRHGSYSAFSDVPRAFPPHPENMLFNTGLTVYARVDGGFSVWDNARNFWMRERSLVSIPSYDFSPDALWNGLEREGRTLCNGLIRDWVSWQLRRNEPFQRLERVLKVLSPGVSEPLTPGEPTRISVDDVRDIPTLRMPYGVVPVTHASAAVRRILGLAYLLVWAWEEHVRAAELLKQPTADYVVLLVDELEAHLHPRWQRLIVPALLEVVRALGADVPVQVLAVTHAPLVLASVESRFDESKDALFMFDLVGNEVKVTQAEWRPRGDANAWLTSEVFDLKEPRSVEAEQAITEAKAALKNPNLSVEEVRRIHNELHRLLKDTDPFWPRWLARADAAGIEP